ncbi:MAG: hypothetical protein A49_21080 [Methyloceanibacter sp.]|nr:MAG: hypothetical protein A49_21080 [Methyloceanibacter sp.]
MKFRSKLQSEAIPQTIAETIFYLPTPQLRQELEAYRVRWEQTTGNRVDLTLRYTSIWPEPQRTWLLTVHPKKFYEGLPEFAKAYIRDKIDVSRCNGTLDDIPDTFLRLFAQGDLGPRTR